MDKVCVILSTYNGERYLSEQINSILKQNDVETCIVIRDDGSTDSTRKILNEYESDRVRIIKGDNVGYANSFLLAMKESFNADYYALSDQDDIWLDDKLSRAIECIKYQSSDLYSSGLNVVDENGNFLYEKKVDNYISTIGSVLSRNRLAGCTMVFNKALYNLLIENVDSIIQYNKADSLNFGHDGWILLLAISKGMTLYVDSESRILYRRHPNTVTYTHGGVKKRIRHEIRTFKNIEDRRVRISNFLLHNIDIKDKETERTLEYISNYKSKFTIKMILIFTKRIKTGILIVDIKNIFALIFGRY